MLTKFSNGVILDLTNLRKIDLRNEGEIVVLFDNFSQSFSIENEREAYEELSFLLDVYEKTGLIVSASIIFEKQKEVYTRIEEAKEKLKNMQNQMQNTPNDQESIDNLFASKMEALKKKLAQKKEE